MTEHLGHVCHPLGRLAHDEGAFVLERCHVVRDEIGQVTSQAYAEYEWSTDEGGRQVQIRGVIGFQPRRDVVTTVADDVLVCIGGSVRRHRCAQQGHGIWRPRVAGEEEAHRVIDVLRQRPHEAVPRRSSVGHPDEPAGVPLAPGHDRPDDAADVVEPGVWGHDAKRPSRAPLPSEAREGAAHGHSRAVPDDQDQAELRMAPAAGARYARALTSAHPGVVASEVLCGIRRQRREPPRGEEHPFHVGNLPNPFGNERRVGAVERGAVTMRGWG